ncbi:hypothetical protein DWZ36_18925 [Phocaeicola vulgatus]|nr:hypothetical protein DWZ36_18925 [Phocaeicola vulgatus]
MWQSLKFLNHLQKQKSLSHSDSSKKNGVQTSSVTEWETLFLKWHNMACSLWYVRFWGKFILTDTAIIANESLILWSN